MQLFSGNKGFRDEPLIRICDESQIVCVATQTLLAVNEMPDKAFHFTKKSADTCFFIHIAVLSQNSGKI